MAPLKVMLSTMLFPAWITSLRVAFWPPRRHDEIDAFAFPMFLTVKYSVSFWTTGDPTIIRAPWFAAAAPVESIQLTAIPVTARAATVTRIVIIGVEISPLLLLILPLFLFADIFPRKTWML